jgi:hypothetical protein
MLVGCKLVCQKPCMGCSTLNDIIWVLRNFLWNEGLVLVETCVMIQSYVLVEMFGWL